jgi:hypothetical protein
MCIIETHNGITRCSETFSSTRMIPRLLHTIWHIGFIWKVIFKQTSRELSDVILVVA